MGQQYQTQPVTTTPYGIESHNYQTQPGHHHLYFNMAESTDHSHYRAPPSSTPLHSDLNFAFQSTVTNSSPGSVFDVSMTPINLQQENESSEYALNLSIGPRTPPKESSPMQSPETRGSKREMTPPELESDVPDVPDVPHVPDVQHVPDVPEDTSQGEGPRRST